MSDITPDPWRDHREREAQKKWNKDRLDRLRASLRTLVGKTLAFDLTTSTDQLAPRVLGCVEQVHDEVVVVRDMSDASIAPSAKPLRIISLGQIRDARLA